MEQYPNLYNNLRQKPMLEGQPSLCAELDQINSALMMNPSCQSVRAALNFLQQKHLAIRFVFGRCAWTYACAPGPNGPQSWEECVENVKHVLSNALVHLPNKGRPCDNIQTSSAMQVALQVWSKFHYAITSGCCGKLPSGELGAKWVIHQTPNTSPFYGRSICMPTLTPSKTTERSYNSRDECDMSLSQLPPQMDYVPYQAQVYCNDYGCFLEPDWGPKPISVDQCVTNCGCENGCDANQWGRVPSSDLYCTQSCTQCGPQLELGEVASFFPNQ